MALATVHTLGDVPRFARVPKQVTAFAGLDPLERPSREALLDRSEPRIQTKPKTRNASGGTCALGGGRPGEKKKKNERV